MIISPPFLPPNNGKQEDEAWLDQAMAQPASRLLGSAALEGSFPLSHNLAWHNGIHIQAPPGTSGSLPVCAIADGEVIFVKEPTSPNTNVDDGQNYNPFDRGGGKTAAWTDNGCIIIAHRTEIGALGTVTTEVVYYSLYMHLAEIGKIAPAAGQAKRRLRSGDAIWRKDEIGKPGKIYGDSAQIHFEIACDEANLQKLMGRAPNWVEPAIAPGVLPAPAADGRVDSIFGSMYFYLPASTPTAIVEPKTHLRANAATSLGSAIWVKMTYANKGDCVFESFDERGASLGAMPREVDTEYNLYKAANDRHNSLSATDQTQSSPSGWYELLRFGRNVGHGPAATDKDPLPANAANWQRIVGPAKQLLWADLNATGSFKFSDADFPPVMGWKCISDDKSPNDQRCDSPNIKTLIRDPDAANANRMESEELVKRLGHKEVQARLCTTIAKFPCEWDKATIEGRYGFVKELDNFKKSSDAWDRLKKHLGAISFEGLPRAYKDAQWHWDPTEFVRHFRKCLWLNEPEFSQLLPRSVIRDAGKKGFVWEGVGTDIRAQSSIFVTHRIAQNAAMRKYGIDRRSRMTAYFGNSVQETQWWSKLHENLATAWYAPWDGRGFLQLTHPYNYMTYWRFRGRAIDASLYSRMEKASKAKTSVSDLTWPKVTVQMIEWRDHVAGEGLDASEKKIAPADSAGFYWAKNEMARFADQAKPIERKVVQTGSGSKPYYSSESFWDASASVNRPASVENYGTGFNGYVARCVPWAQALAVLGEVKFPSASGASEYDYPEGHLPRRER